MTSWSSLPGIAYMYEAIPGYPEAKDFLPVGFRPFEHIALRRQIDQFEEQGGEFVMYIPNPPYRCPPGPYERAAMLAWRLKTKGVKGKVIVLDANPQPVSKAPGFLAAYNDLYKDYLGVRSQHPHHRPGLREEASEDRAWGTCPSPWPTSSPP
jgi:hypothetical protein